MAARLPSRSSGGLPDLGLGVVVLARHVKDVDALVGQRAHRRVDGLRRKVGTVERDHDIGHGQGTSLPS